MAERPTKLRYRRLEPTILKFIKVAIPTDLERLQKHQINIEKYQRFSKWDKLHQEHINASRTVQQLRANMREMETICLRVRDEDSQTLETIISPLKERAAAAVEEFLKVHSQCSDVSSNHGRTENSQDPHSSLLRSQTIAGTFASIQDSGTSLPQHSVQLSLPLPQIPQDHDAAESWENLEENLIDLSNLVTEFSQQLHLECQCDSFESRPNRRRLTALKTMSVLLLRMLKREPRTWRRPLNINLQCCLWQVLSLVV
ncbi:syntaxin-17 isoform X2 [Amblyraja radiata]|uniref:syntaxin-17 isoform X2 n=1 Tax=Amblyraja radiata TaxID=386614 RepID=UPI00140357F4|nr:syntaxin-17 isoform X2 [Amblyraja radiata]